MSVEQGILLAGGLGRRLWPITKGVCKQLLPVHDKPLVYYPLSSLMLAGIRRIAIVTKAEDRASFERLLGDGRQWGIELRYVVQAEPRGLADGLLVAESVLEPGPVALALGDNIFYGRGFTTTLRAVAERAVGATVFAYPVGDGSQYGVIELDALGRPTKIEEKPQDRRNALAVTGLYFYDAKAFQWAEKLLPSQRGELEITDLNRMYLEAGELQVEVLGRGFVWMDAGTRESYAAATSYVESVETRQGLKIACPEEIAWRLGYISSSQLELLAGEIPNEYGRYLSQLAANGAGEGALILEE